MAGGKIRLLWDRDVSAVVNIYDASGTASTAFTVAGSAVSFPYDLTGDTTFTTTKGDTYSLSVKLNGVEIADEPDGAKRVDLIGAGSTELIIAPTPDDGFVSPTGPGVTETAFLIATGPSLLSDGSDQPVTFEGNPARGDLPSWVSLVDGNPTLGNAAGTCAFSARWAYDYDFTAATGVCGASGTIASAVTFKMDGANLFGGTINPLTGGNGQDLQTTNESVRGDVVAGSTLTATAAAYADEDGVTVIEDAVVTPRFSLNITRLAPGAPLPTV